MSHMLAIARQEASCSFSFYLKLKEFFFVSLLFVNFLMTFFEGSHHPSNG